MLHQQPQRVHVANSTFSDFQFWSPSSHKGYSLSGAMSERNTVVNSAKRGEDEQLRAGACRIIGCAKITSPGPPVSSTTRTASLLPQEQDWTLTKLSRCSMLTPI